MLRICCELELLCPTKSLWASVHFTHTVTLLLGALYLASSSVITLTVRHPTSTAHSFCLSSTPTFSRRLLQKNPKIMSHVTMLYLQNILDSDFITLVRCYVCWGGYVSFSIGSSKSGNNASVLTNGSTTLHQGSQAWQILRFKGINE